MKKLKTIILLLLITMFIVSPTFMGYADDTKEIYYPVGISDYVDLNNISDFAINGNQIFYTTDNQSVICYDKTTKTATELVQNVNQGNIQNIQVAGDYVFIFSTQGKTFAYRLTDLTAIEFSNAPTGFNIISVNYVDNKYYFGYIKTSTTNYFVLDVYTSLGSSKTTIPCSITFSYEILNSKIVFSNNLIAIKPLVGNKIYLIKDYTTTDELTLLDSNSGNYHEITGFNSETNISDIAVLNFEDDIYTNRIFIGYEGSSKTQICNFNGLKLTYEDDNNIVSDKLCVYNNTLYVYNSTNADINICNYNNKTNELTTQELFIAGKGSEEGRFKDVDELTYKSGTYYVTDSGNDRIQVLNDKGITTIDEIYGEITEIVVDNNNNYYYAVYSPGLNSSVLYKNGQAISSTFSSTKIVSIAINLDNTIYLLSETQIITFKSRYSYTSRNLTSLEVNDSSKLRIVNNYINNATPTAGVVEESIYTVSVDDTIYCISLTTGNTLNKHITFESNIVDYKVNYTATNSPIFALLSDGSFVRTSLTESSDKNVTLTGFSDYTCFDMDVVTGELYLYNNNLSAIEKYNNPDFCVKTNMVHYNINAYNHNGFSELWQYTQIKSKALIYDYYNYTGNYIELGEVTNAIVLQVPVDSKTGALGEFAYVGYTLNNKLVFGYVQTANLVDGIKPMAITDNTYKLRTTNKNVQVYKYPSIFNDLTFYSFAQGDIITTYGKYISSIDNYEYYIVKIGNEYGYICSNDVTLSENTTKNVRTNATIKIFDGKEKVNVYLTADESGSILYKLSDGYKINVTDYNKNDKFTKITFIDEDQQEREGYVLTSYVKLAGMSTTVITAIVLLVLDIIIAVIVIVFYHHYKKKQRVNSKD